MIESRAQTRHETHFVANCTLLGRVGECGWSGEEGGSKGEEEGSLSGDGSLRPRSSLLTRNKRQQPPLLLPITHNFCFRHVIFFGSLRHRRRYIPLFPVWWMTGAEPQPACHKLGQRTELERDKNELFFFFQGWVGDTWTAGTLESG